MTTTIADPEVAENAEKSRAEIPHPSLTKGSNEGQLWRFCIST